MTTASLHNIRGIIFDFDGVLVDTEWAIYQSWVRLYSREGKEISIETYAPCLGAGYTHWDPAKHLEELTGKEYDWVTETAMRQAEIEADLQESGLMEGAIELFDWCEQQGIRLTVASSSSRRWVAGWLEKLGITERFCGVFTRTDGYPVKPNPALFHAAQHCLGLSAEECLIIEDSENGTRAAQNAGIPCTAIANRMTCHSDLSRAQWRVTNLKALLELLKNTQTSC